MFAAFINIGTRAAKLRNLNLITTINPPSRYNNTAKEDFDVKDESVAGTGGWRCGCTADSQAKAESPTEARVGTGAAVTTERKQPLRNQAPTFSSTVCITRFVLFYSCKIYIVMI